MVSLRDEKVAMQPSESPQDNQIIESAKPEIQQIEKAPAPHDKKRKADATWAQQYHSEEGVNKENAREPEERPSTPPPFKKEKISTKEEVTPYEKTPGRDGPIKPENFNVSPDISPFKGPPGKKVRKTASEKEAEYAQFVLETEDHPFHELHVCHAKGPNGSPTYDKSGFQLDWKKVNDWMRPKPYNKKRAIKGMEKAVNKARQETEAMAAIFFEKGEAPAESQHAYNGYWKDRVSKDLNVPWHRVGVKEFEEWEKRGFKKARKGEYENPTIEERARMLRLLSGASLRK